MKRAGALVLSLLLCLALGMSVMIKFLNYFLDCDEEDEIPPTSILREFIGGCTFYGE